MSADLRPLANPSHQSPPPVERLADGTSRLHLDAMVSGQSYEVVRGHFQMRVVKSEGDYLSFYDLRSVPDIRPGLWDRLREYFAVRGRPS
jgi:hypothetical protein